MPSERLYFPGLNGLRFFAALMVWIHHAELYKLSLGLPSCYLSPGWHPLLEQFGSQGVGIFFVLSGFLITYLLLEEKKQSGKIHVLRFYLRRILRIWPLYFLMVCLGFFVFPFFGYPPELHVKLTPYYWTKLSLMLLFFPNLVLSLFGFVFPVAPLWSIGIEEQFYLIWPHLLTRYDGKLARFLIGFVLVCIAVKLAAEFGFTRLLPNYLFWKLSCQALFDSVRFDSMALGGLAACLVCQGHVALLKILYRRDVQAAVLVGALVLYLANPPLHAFHDLIYGSLYAVLILNVATNPRSLLKPVHRVWDGLGRISFGLYVYHTPIQFALLYGLKPYASGWFFEPAFYGLGFGLTVAVAALSYRYFESPILGWKDRLAPQRP